MIKGIIDRIKKSFEKELVKTGSVIFGYDDIVKLSVEELKRLHNNFDSNVKCLDYYTNIVLQFSDKKKIDFAAYCINQIYLHDTKEDFHTNGVRLDYATKILNSRIRFEGEDLKGIFQTIFLLSERELRASLHVWDFSCILKEIELQRQGSGLSQSMREALLYLKTQAIAVKENKYSDYIIVEIVEKVDKLLFDSAEAYETRSVLFIGQDDFSVFANNLIGERLSEERLLWYKLVEIAQKVKGSKPSNKFNQETLVLARNIGMVSFKEMLLQWFYFLLNLKEKEIVRSQDVYYVHSLNVDPIRGFIWMSVHFNDDDSIQLLCRLAEKCCKTIPYKGPLAPSIGNACIFALSEAKNFKGIGQLSRLKLRIRQTNTTSLIEKYISEAAKKLGISSDEIEDISVEDFDLVDGVREYKFEGFKCVLEVIGAGKSSLRWFKEGGTEQKTVPLSVKEGYTNKLKEIKETQKQLDQVTVTQRDRIDRMFRGNRVMDLAYFKAKYLEHGLLSILVRKIIYVFLKGELRAEAIYHNGVWKTNNSEIVEIDSFDQVTLWHPVTSSTDEVKKWRDFLNENQILQPLKQAYREIYLVTDAEINTRVYSNRMASHILKQHQFVALAKARNWAAKFMGGWDGGYESFATLKLPDHNLKVQYWVNSIDGQFEYSDSGMSKYISTDQIRFLNLENNEVVELANVPLIPFTEALRDVDLFVGVASVGNDPNWVDSGEFRAHRGYWHSYSFGDLSEIAKNRKVLLSALVPKLKISSVTSMTDRFVIVKGKIRTYKIHIGSTNILMEPNDEYLCIVPDRGSKVTTGNIFLPFEGDTGLSVILSKAFLLAEDDKITDKTITSQINRKY
ncbi:DUF4132 domain-containing protein [Emticicia sp. CRIBPO]|uniref:DUF4132 domain-containing protein n=1 Tax=Emticicia sp. CRIBPO TaxID=2683258 RepID=UPI001411E979|nr:DUF4132 domain-containing protein [Emticicia sp. CRIBPO]NBA84815.1 DUF4132 domain-containing protein [Emticicia sp. CRIBPO]